MRYLIPEAWTMLALDPDGKSPHPAWTQQDDDFLKMLQRRSSFLAAKSGFMDVLTFAALTGTKTGLYSPEHLKLREAIVFVGLVKDARQKRDGMELDELGK